MGILDFVTRNYANILLIVALVIAIFLTHFQKEKKSFIVFSFLIVSLIYTIFHYFYISENKDNMLITSGIIIEIAILLYSYYIVSISKKNHIIYIIPLILSIPFYFIFDGNILVAFIACFSYLLLLLVRSILILCIKKEDGGIILLICTITCLAAVIFDYLTKNYGILISTLIVCEIVFFVRYFIKEENKKKVSQEKYIQNQKTSIAISQIQPHFLYNSLATIGYLCKKDSKMASLAIDKFSDYLRANLNSLSNMSNVPFAEELKHVKTYLWLEKLRFEERLEIEYDIQVNDFLIPSLSIQPLVENAVKHGICNKIDGGKLIIRTIPYNECIKVVIEDNGVGFDMNSEKKNDGKTHVGIENVKSRIASMANGTLEIQSTVGKGTISTITLPRR